MIKTIKAHPWQASCAGAAPFMTILLTWYALRGTGAPFAFTLRMIIGAFLLAGYIAAICFCSTLKPIKPTRLLALLFIPLALAMLIALPIGRVPDEDSHLQRIWLLSEGQFSAGSSAELSEPVGLLEGITDESVTHSSLSLIRHEQVNTERVASSAGFNTGIYPPVSYMPQALLVAVTRIFTQNRIVLLYAARIGGLLATFALLYQAVRLLPRGKSLFIAITLMPIALQEEMSASADGLAIGAAALLVAWVLRHRMEQTQLSPKHMIQLALLCTLTVVCKMIYFPAILLPLTIPSAQWGSRSKKACAITAAWGVALTVALGWLALCYVGYVSGQVSAAGESGVGTIMPQLTQMLSHPFTFLVVAVRTIVSQLLPWLHTMLGSAMSALNVLMPTPLLLLEAVGLALIWWYSDALPARRFRADRLLMLCTAVLSLLVMLAALYCWWNPYQANVINGMQGRYLIPMLLPCLLAIRFRKGDTHGDAQPVLLMLPAVTAVAFIARTAALCL